MTNDAATNGNGHAEGSKNGSTNFTVKAGLAKMMKGGVIMDVVNAEQVHTHAPGLTSLILH